MSKPAMLDNRQTLCPVGLAFVLLSMILFIWAARPPFFTSTAPATPVEH